MSKVLDVQNLKISFATDNGKVQAVRDVSFSIEKGKTLAIVGESGSGKSVTAKAILGISAANAIIEGGSIMYDDMDLTKLSDEEFNKLRGNRITMIFQDPMSSLDPIMKIGKQMTEATLLNVKTNRKYGKKAFNRKMKELKKLFAAGEIAGAEELCKNFEKEVSAADVDMDSDSMKAFLSKLQTAYQKADSALSEEEALHQAHAFVNYMQEQVYLMNRHVTLAQAKEQAISIMKDVGIAEPEKRFNQYPFEFSGGMRQRIVIAIAIAANPDILVCDEPTTALDVTIQSQILELIERLQEERKLTVIFITHDLGVVANVADEVAVMYAGKIVEYGTVNEIFYEPKHPYTWALLSSMPDLETKEKLVAIPGTPPNMIHPPKGDAFAERNEYAMEIDFEQEPPFFEVSPTHKAATWLLHPNAPHVDPPKIVTERIARMKKINSAYEQAQQKLTASTTGGTGTAYGEKAGSTNKQEVLK